MLSPNARNFVFRSCGIALTTTRKEQLPLCWRLSTASQVTVVVPGLNSAPPEGVQVTVTGGAPFCAAGVSKAMVGLLPLCAVTAMSDGQLTVGSSMTGLGW